MTVLNALPDPELVKLQTALKDIDPDAFLNVVSSAEIMGKGFKPLVDQSSVEENGGKSETKKGKSSGKKWTIFIFSIVVIAAVLWIFNIFAPILKSPLSKYNENVEAVADTTQKVCDSTAVVTDTIVVEEVVVESSTEIMEEGLKQLDDQQ